jgi:hypothetical protein
LKWPQVKTYRRGNELADPLVYVLESLLGVFELSKQRVQEGFRAIDVVFRRVMAVHAVFVIWVALDVKYMPLANVSARMAHTL